MLKPILFIFLFMEKDQIKLGDWYRILIGDAPTEFLLEVFIRTTILYITLLIILTTLKRKKVASAAFCHAPQQQLFQANMEHSKIPKDQVFAKLRGFRVKHLVEVKRLYLEADGSFSLMRRQEVVAGLCILPEWDKAFIGRLEIQQDEKVCDNCGCR